MASSFGVKLTCVLSINTAKYEVMRRRGFIQCSFLGLGGLFLVGPRALSKKQQVELTVKWHDASGQLVALDQVEQKIAPFLSKGHLDRFVMQLTRTGKLISKVQCDDSQSTKFIFSDVEALHQFISAREKIIDGDSMMRLGLTPVFETKYLS